MLDKNMKTVTEKRQKLLNFWGKYVFNFSYAINLC